ncbi:MAG: hypothetical protein ACP5UQ_02845, partial [Anaerolineae bacterium]
MDPDSAVGILKAFHDAHVADWPLAATFFIPAAGEEPGAEMFGQGDAARSKLHALAAWGLEIGSYGAGGGSLRGKGAGEIQRELGLGQMRLERWLPGLRVTAFALSDGAWPADRQLLATGEHAGMKYEYTAVVGSDRGLAPSPRAGRLDPHRIPRI